MRLCYKRDQGWSRWRRPKLSKMTLATFQLSTKLIAGTTNFTVWTCQRFNPKKLALTALLLLETSLQFMTINLPKFPWRWKTTSIPWYQNRDIKICSKKNFDRMLRKETITLWKVKCRRKNKENMIHLLHYKNCNRKDKEKRGIFKFL